MEVILLLITGLKQKQIATMLGRSYKTINDRLHDAQKKMKAKSVVHLISILYQKDILSS